MQKSRREFIKTAGLAVSALPLAGFNIINHSELKADLTIQEAINLILSKVPGEKRKNTVDTVKSSDPNQKLTGIVTTFLATVDVIRAAIEQKANLIITHEPTYYNHLDETDWLKNDPVYQYKRDLLEKNNIVVWRFHDFWHQVRPDGILHGFLGKMDWRDNLNPKLENSVIVPETSMKKLAKQLKKKLGLDRTFIVGNPDMTCSKIGLLPGAWGRDPQISLLQKDIDVLVVGEVAEWETSEYVRDAAAAGMKKGLIILGHALSEEPGMEYLVEWLKPVLPEVPVFHMASGDAFQKI